MTLLIDIGLAIGVATLLSYFTYLFKQPNILAYILTGLLIGPLFLGLITDQESISTLGELGVAFLLFSAGMELDARKLKRVGIVALIGGIVQVFVSFGIGFFIASMLGFETSVSLITGLLLAFSSTMLVTKILIERNEINSLHGKIIIGILMIQDVFALFVLIVLGKGLTEFASVSTSPMLVPSSLFSSLFDGGLFLLIRNVSLVLIIALVLNRIVFKHLLKYIAKDSELLFMTTVATLFLFIGMSYTFELPMAAAALIAGLSISSTPFSVGAAAEIRSLRVFFSALFFVALGMQINIFLPTNLLVLGIVLIILTVAVKPLLLAGEYLILGYGFVASSLIGLYLGQASEFSFIIIQQAMANSFISHDIGALMTLVVVVSMAITPYSVSLSKEIHKLRRRIRLPERFSRNIRLLEHKKRIFKDHIIIIGCHRIGYNIAKFLKKRDENVLVIDHDPETIFRLREEGSVDYLFGDAENEEMLELAHADKAKMVIITVVDVDAALFVTEWVRIRNKDAMIIARAHRKSSALELYNAGADWVVLPEMVGSNETVKQVDRFLEMPEDRFENEKVKHISELKKFIE